MDVTHTSRGIGAFMSNWSDPVRHSRQAFQQLVKAVDAGDLGAAQDAFSRLGVAPAPPPADAAAPDGAAPAPASAAATDPRAMLAAGMQALGAALQSGDVDAARDVLTQLQHDLTTVRTERRGDHPTPEMTTVMDAPAPPPITGQDGGTATFYGVDVKA